MSHTLSSGGQDEREDMKHVLVVDDEEAIVYIFRRYLEAAGYRVSTAHDGVEALALFDGEPIDALVTDARMPRMNGNELISRVRPRHPDLPIAVVSAYPLEIAAAAGERLRVLSKPIEGKTLVETVTEMLA
jgi:CheY-like chemotaxis protein